MIMLVAMTATAWAQCDPDQTDCSITVVGYDQYGDGWNGASLDIYQDTVLHGTFSVSGGSSTMVFPACSGPVSFVWNPGAYDSECSFTVTDSLGVVLYSCTSASGLGGTFGTSYACPSCIPPSTIEVAVSSDSAQLAWTTVQDALGYYYQYSTASSPNGPWTFTTDTSLLLTELLANTVYNFFVRSYCGDDDTSIAAVQSFRTLCGEMAVPFSEGFEDNGAFPTCWTLWESSSYNSYGYIYSYPQIYSYNAHTGSYCFNMYSDYGPNSIISPRVYLPANQLEVTFWAYGYGGYIQVGYTDTDDSATAVFHLVENVQLREGSVYDLYTVSFDSIANTDSVHVVLRVANNPAYVYIYVDDITIRQVSNCPAVDSLQMTATASHEVTLQWSSPAATAWEVAYGPAGFNPDFDTVRAAAGTNSFVLTGLSDSVVYDIYVRSVCGTDHGYWSLPITVQPNVYNMPNSGSDTLVTCGMAIADMGGVAGPLVTGANSTLVIIPSDSSEAIQLGGMLNLGSATLNVYEGIGTGGHLLASLTGMVNDVTLTSAVGPMTLNLVTSYTSSPGFVLYTSCVPLALCTDVYNLDVSNVTARSAHVSWSYSDVTVPAFFTITAADTANDNILYFTAPDTARSITITGLEQHTYYEVGVMVTCESSDTSAVVSTTIFTPCLAGGEILIGDPNTTSSSAFVPDYTYYNYSISQQIYDSTEVAGMDTIFGIKFFKVSGSNVTRTIDVYIDTTTRGSFNSVAEGIIAQSLDKRRFSGEVSVVDGWNEIQFSQPFAYNGHGNIVITFDDNTGSYQSSFSSATHSTTDNRAIYGYSDGVNLDPADSATLNALSYGSSVMNQVNNMIFVTPCSEATCVAPAVLVGAVDSGSVALSWVAGLYESEWSVEYRVAGTNEWMVHNYGTTQDTAIVTGLLPATTYDFRLGSLCGDTVAYRVVTATTSCAPYRTLPLTENFDNFTALQMYPDMETCWGRYTNYTSSYSTYYYPYVYDYSYYARSGYSLSFQAYGTEYFSQLMLPEMGVDVDTLTLSFYMMGTYTSYYSYQAVVGVQTSMDDISSFVPVDSVMFTGEDYEWQLVEFDLSGYTGQGRIICLRTGNQSSSGFYIDDLKLDYTNPCKRPTNVMVTDATMTSVRITFDDTNNAGNYVLYYGVGDSLADATDSVVFTTTNYVLNGLPTATHFHGWLRTNCGTTRSGWVEVPEFSTRCMAVVVNDTQSYETDFESGMDICMAQERIDGRLWWESATTTSNPAGAYNGGHIMHLYNYSRSGETRLLLPLFDFSALTDDAELTFYLAQEANGAMQDKLYISYRTAGSSQWTVFDSVTNSISSWTRQYFTLPNSAGSANYEVALLGKANTGYGIKIDELSVHRTPRCPRPQALAVSDVTNESAIVSWTGSAPEYEVSYRTEGSWSWRIVTTTANSVALTGLLNVSPYEVRVRALCGSDGRSEWSDIAAFVTNACVNALFYYNYDAATVRPSLSNNAPADVYNPYTYSEVLVDASTLAGLDGIVAFGFNPTNAQVGGCFGNCDVYFGLTTDTVLTGFHFDSSFVHVYHGSMNYNSPGWKYFRLDSVYNYNGTSNLIVAINRQGNTGSYGVQSGFAGHINNCVKTRSATNYNNPINPFEASSLPVFSQYTDTVSPDYAFLACAPYCEAPVAEVTAVSATSVSLHWLSDSRNAQVSWRRAADTVWSTPVDVEGYTYTVEGLDHSTDYLFRVRQNCMADSLGVSPWSQTSAMTDYVCNVPRDVVVDDITNSRATVSWTPAEGDNLWEVRVFNNGFDQTWRTRQPSYLVKGLTAGERYHCAVRTLCGPDHAFVGEWSEPVDFATYFCGAVGGVRAEAIGNAVKLTWVAGDHNTYWEVQYGRAGYTESEVINTVFSPDTHIIIYNLVPNFTYGFRVRALCGLNWNSDWTSNEVTVTTGEELGIVDAGQGYECSIYPNPAQNRVSIAIKGVEGRVEVRVVDMNGRVVAHESLDCSADCTKLMDVSDLSGGAYFVHIVGESVNSVHKLVVK